MLKYDLNYIWNYAVIFLYCFIDTEIIEISLTEEKHLDKRVRTELSGEVNVMN